LSLGKAVAIFYADAKARAIGLTPRQDHAASDDVVVLDDAKESSPQSVRFFNVDVIFERISRTDSGVLVEAKDSNDSPSVEQWRILNGSSSINTSSVWRYLKNALKVG